MPWIKEHNLSNQFYQSNEVVVVVQRTLEFINAATNLVLKPVDTNILFSNTLHFPAKSNLNTPYFIISRMTNKQSMQSHRLNGRVNV